MPVDTKIDEDTGRRQSGRAARHSASRILWDESTLTPVKMCGQFPRNDATGEVVIKATGTGAERRAGISGLMTCGSVWACPVCSHKIAAHRAGEVEKAIAEWLKLPGNRIALGTFTMRHSRGQKLKNLWGLQSYAWGKVTSGRGWQNDAARYGRDLFWSEVVGLTEPDEDGKQEQIWSAETGRALPFIAVRETTHGRNGWHIHIHTVLFLGPGQDGEEATQADCDVLRDSMFGRWRDALVRPYCHDCDSRVLSVKDKETGRHVLKICPKTGRPCRVVSGGRAPSRHRGADVKLIGKGEAASTLGEYFTKAVYPAGKAASMEATFGQHKDPKNGNRTPFMILRDVAAVGDADDLDLWHEWEKASRGHRQLTWSQHLREFLGLGKEVKDETIAEDDSLKGDELARLDAAQWPVVKHLRSELMNAAEADDTGLVLYELLGELLPLWNRNRCVDNKG